jgi:electron transport complex protein RnfE
MRTLFNEFSKGLWEQLPPFKLVLGLCPTLAVTKSLEGGLGMGIATTFVLIMSNAIIALIKNMIPSKIRIATYIVIIATFVVITEMMMKAYTPLLFETLGVFVPLLVVNCIILGRAEAFASKNNISRSALDGLGIGTGYTFSLMAIGIIRELIGTGRLTLFSSPSIALTLIPLEDNREYLFKFMQEPAGAFICLGTILMFINIANSKRNTKI